MKSVPRTPITVVGVVTLTCSGCTLAMMPVTTRSVPRARFTSMLPPWVVGSNWKDARSTELSGPSASTVPSFSVTAAALLAPVSTRSAAISGLPTTAALRTLPRTTVTSPCTVLNVPCRASPETTAGAAVSVAGAGATAAAVGAAGAATGGVCAMAAEPASKATAPIQRALRARCAGVIRIGIVVLGVKVLARRMPRRDRSRRW